MLDLAKAEAGRVELRLAPVNLGPLVHACVAEVDSLRQGKDIVLAVDVGTGPVEVVTDAQRVRQILVNLLANAIKFTDRGEVTVTLRATPSEIQLAVRDTGIGISADALRELFQDFHQLEAGDGRRYDGTGMGLALSRRLARALGGEMEVRSTEGVRARRSRWSCRDRSGSRRRRTELGDADAAAGGARARRPRRRACRLPSAKVSLVSIPPAAAFHVDVNGGDVLIVDDFRDTLASTKRSSPTTATACGRHRGAEALAKVDEREPELVLLDVSMPGWTASRSSAGCGRGAAGGRR